MEQLHAKLAELETKLKQDFNQTGVSSTLVPIEIALIKEIVRVLEAQAKAIEDLKAERGGAPLIRHLTQPATYRSM